MEAAEFREQDREWRRRLQGLSLVAEAAIDVDAAIGALRALASKVFVLEAAANRSAMMKRYAPTALAGLTAVASVASNSVVYGSAGGRVAVNVATVTA